MDQTPSQQPAPVRDDVKTPWRLLVLLMTMTAVGSLALNILVPAVPRLAEVRPFLAKQGGPVSRYIVSNKDPEVFIDGFDPSWQGDLPRTYVYDRQGRRAKILSGEQTAPALAHAVAPYLKQ